MKGLRHSWKPCVRTSVCSMAARSRMGRRSFLQALAADAALLGAPRPAPSPYQVGAGSSSDPYTATQRAIQACGQWPAAAVSGKTVMIKPNLVSPLPSSSGATTDPQSVRAVVDLALAAGAAQVLIVEAPPLNKAPYWAACGYDVVFDHYDPRVQLVDLRSDAYTLAPVPGGMAFQSLWLPAQALDPGVFFISVGKMKTHVSAVATLSMKNLYGLADQEAYQLNGPLGRQDLHYRGVDLCAVDLNLARPIHFAVVEAVWAMQGQGPIQGTPVSMNLALAGVNPLAVDRVALTAMQIAQNAVPHLSYASLKGLGPSDVSKVQVLGDSFAPYPFTPAVTGPVVWQPAASPNTFSLGAGGHTSFSYKVPAGCYTRVDVVLDSDATPGPKPVRTLHDYAQISGPGETVVWRGANSSGAPVAPGLYLLRVMARYTPASTPINYGVAMINVTA